MCRSRANQPILHYFSLILFTMLFLRWHRAFREPEAPDSAAVINHDQLSGTGAAGGSSWRQQLGDRRTTRNTLPPTVSIMVMYRPPPPQNSSTSSSSSGLAAMEGQKPGTRNLQECFVSIFKTQLRRILENPILARGSTL